MSNNSTDHLECLNFEPLLIFFTGFNIFNILTLPLFISVLYMVYRQITQHRSALPFPSLSGPTVSHSDMFTFHMAAMEVIGVFSSVMRTYGVFAGKPNVINQGFLMFYFMWYGEVIFHTLTCMDRYLAVVHPIPYMALKQGWAMQLRSVIITSVWLICILSIFGPLKVYAIIMKIAALTVILIAVAFFSLSVLCTLIRKGPGSQRVDKINRNKRRAFRTILIILTVLLLRYMWSLITSIHMIIDATTHIMCLLVMLEFLLWIPAALVLPLLFLHRRRVLACFKHSTR